MRALNWKKKTLEEPKKMINVIGDKFAMSIR